jgi:uncharacterized membrane protein YccC
MQGILKANANYLQEITNALMGKKPDMLEYKLARKDVYVNSANLSAAFQRMLSEPKSKQKGEKEIHQFVVLNHILFSNIATVGTTLLSKEERAYPPELIQMAKRARSILCETGKRLGDNTIGNSHAEPIAGNEIMGNPDDVLMKEQLSFINKISADIDKVTKGITE